MRLLIFSLHLLLASPSSAQTDSLNTSKYVQRIHRYHSAWQSLIPTQFIIQNAGNMGVVSLGVGWEYGRHDQWETHWLIGYIPKFKSNRGKMTMSIKETFIPWRCRLGKDWSIEPLTAGLYLNAVFGHEFWKSQPNRYPDKYYEFMSTKFRLNAFLGERFTRTVPNNRRKFIKSISAFYELSTCDLYIRAMFQDRDVHLTDIVGLSLGLKLQIM
ncbi:hypothetical protein [Prevotella intermedia]|uniref:DUF3575 domain-containing protein n=1 Tax=Prevotella intermedia TaxID=28131 RepID=A0A2D3NAZ2_PREIN|nr:hypothetical protein [Prevotella intermedia]ATV51884.1 hypothetical protein CTM50_01630 [Prevotella intermedia]